MLYPLTLAMISRITNTNPTYHDEATLQYYSITHVALALFVVITLMCLSTDLSFFMQVSSMGVIFIIMMVVFMIITGM